MESLLDSKILKDLGLNAKNTWIIYDKAPKAFFDHLTANFDDNNLLSEEELLKIRELEEAGELLLSGDAIARQLSAIEEQIPDVHEINDDEHLKRLESDLDLYTNLLCNRGLRCDRIQQTMQEVQAQIDELERENFELARREKELTETVVVDAVRQLDQLTDSNQASYKTMNDLIVQRQNRPTLMSSLVEDHDTNKLKLMTSQLEHFITSCIESGDDDHAKVERKNATIIEVYKKIRELDSKILADEVALEGFVNIRAIESYELGNIQNVCDMQDEIAKIQLATEKLDDYHAMLMSNLITTTEKHQELQNASLFDEFFRARTGQAKNQLNSIKQANEILENVIQLVELIWFALSVDMQRLNGRVDSSLEVNSAAESVNLRINLMKNSNNSNRSDMTAGLIFRRISAQLGRYQPTIDIGSSSDDLTAALQTIVKVHDEIEECRQTCASGKHLYAIHEQLALIESQRKRLAEFVFNGPTSCPMLVDCKFLTSISAEEQRTRQLEKLFEEMKTRFSTDILQPWQTDEINRLMKNLWIYFMTEPPKFFSAIQKIKRRASEKGAMTLNSTKITK